MRALANRGTGRVDAVLIEVKNVQATAVGVTPPEALPSSGMGDVRVLIDNPRVIVTRQRYAPNAYTTRARHFHPHDSVVVYRRGGYTWLPYGHSGPARVRGGDLDIVPANTWHTFGNAGSDPLEFLAIFPK